jgi:hypothetical protein
MSRTFLGPTQSPMQLASAVLSLEVRRVMLPIHLRLVPELRMNGAVPHVLNMPS